MKLSRISLSLPAAPRRLTHSTSAPLRKVEREVTGRDRDAELVAQKVPS